jgi:SAM-dependent methyltransferase
VNDLSRFQNPRFAGMWRRVSRQSESRGTGAYRAGLLAGLSGRAIEVGAGNGLNFRHYPPAVTEVVAVEPESSLRALAEQAATEAPVPIRVVAGHADGLADLIDGGFDAAVTSLVLCSVPDQARSLLEIRRMLRPGGELRFFEHVRSPIRLLAVVQDLITPLWSRAAGGCHLNRDTLRAIATAGFDIVSATQIVYRPVRLSLPQTHILGRARVGQARP